MADPRKVLTRFDDYRGMMADSVRMSAYERAIASMVRPGDVVVDMGSGLGILSLLALRAGAERVYAIEQADSIELARAVAQKAALADRIVFLHESSLVAELPERADVLVSETLGSFAIDENTLEFTIDARKRLLVPGARMVPNKLGLFLAPVQHLRGHEELLFWQSISGFDFSPAMDEILSRMSLADIEPDALLGPAQLVQSIDLASVESAEISISRRFDLTKAGTIHGLAGWFEVDLGDGIVIDTSPESPRTHWRQAFFPFRTPVSVAASDFLDLRFQMGPRGDHSDNTTVSYQYFCSQRADGPEKTRVPKSAPCPCGSGRRFDRCCGKTSV